MIPSTLGQFNWSCTLKSGRKHGYLGQIDHFDAKSGGLRGANVNAMRASLSLGYSGLSRVQLSKIHLRKLLVSIKSTKFYIKHYELIVTKFEMQNRISSCALCCSSEKYYEAV